MLLFLSWLGAQLASVAYLFGIRTRVTLENLQAAYPNASKQEIRGIAQRSYVNLGRVFGEMVYLRFASSKAVASHLTITNPESVRAAMRNECGAILLSAHLANWEWMALGTGVILQRPLAVVVKNQRGSFAERFLDAMRTRHGNVTIGAGDVRKIYRTLGENGIVAMLGDQAAPVESVRTTFFGREVPTFEGPARFALRTRAPLLLAECKRVKASHYKMTFHQVPFEDLTEPSDNNVRELTQRHTSLLEHIIRTSPELWLWQHKRWKNAN